MRVISGFYIWRFWDRPFRTCSLRLLRLKTEESGGELSLAALVAAREGYAEILRSASDLDLQKI